MDEIFDEEYWRACEVLKPAVVRQIEQAQVIADYSPTSRPWCARCGSHYCEH